MLALLTACKQTAAKRQPLATSLLNRPGTSIWSGLAAPAVGSSITAGRRGKQELQDRGPAASAFFRSRQTVVRPAPQPVSGRFRPIALAAKSRLHGWHGQGASGDRRFNTLLQRLIVGVSKKNLQFDVGQSVQRRWFADGAEGSDARDWVSIGIGDCSARYTPTTAPELCVTDLSTIGPGSDRDSIDIELAWKRDCQAGRRTRDEHARTIK